MRALFQDIRFGARILVHSPVVTLWVILALALGIGANTAVFSVVDAFLLHPVDYAHPEQLVIVTDKDAQGLERGASAANFLDWRDRTRAFSDLAAWVPVSYVLTEGDHVEQVQGASVSANFFRTLGVQPALGRAFSDGEDGITNPAGPAHIAVISYNLWQTGFGADRGVLGKKIELNSVSYDVVGVAPADFVFHSRRQVWIPAAINRQDRDYHYMVAVGRLREPRSRATEEMAALAAALGREYPASNGSWTIGMQDLLDWLVNSTFRTRLLLLFGAVGMVLLITCTNVAGLLLTRSIARGREMAVRAALGASQWRILRQLLAENVMLAFLGAAAGLVVAGILIRVAPAIVPPSAMITASPFRMSWSVVGFALLLALFTGVLFGMAPAAAGLRLDLQQELREGGRGSTLGKTRQRFRQFMVALQVALALMLLVSATLMSESLNNATRVSPGFDVRNIMAARLYLPESRYTAEKSIAFEREAIERIRALPGVTGVTGATTLPLLGVTMDAPFDLEDSPPRTMGERPDVGYISVYPGFFEALGIPIKNGRALEETDNESSPPVVVVNQAFVERYFPAQNPVGRRILLNRPLMGRNGFEDTIRPQIVGVVGNVRMRREGPVPRPIVYAAQTQNSWSPVTWFAVRTSGEPGLLAGAVRAELAKIDREEPIDQLSTLEETFTNDFAEPRFQTVMMSGFAVLALLLAVIGIYGVNAYGVAQRRHEIGVRMALGARPMTVLGEVMAGGMRLTAIGIVAGLGGAMAGASLLRSVLVGISATDPLTLVTVALVLAAVSAIACYLPARRAMRVDPAQALRQD